MISDHDPSDTEGERREGAKKHPHPYQNLMDMGVPKRYLPAICKECGKAERAHGSSRCEGCSIKK